MAICLRWAIIIPFTALQILHVTLITSCTLAIILTIEPTESRIMGHPPHQLEKRLLLIAQYMRYSNFHLLRCPWIGSRKNAASR